MGLLCDGHRLLLNKVLALEIQMFANDQTVMNCLVEGAWMKMRTAVRQNASAFWTPQAPAGSKQACACFDQSLRAIRVNLSRKNYAIVLLLSLIAYRTTW